MRAYAIIFSIFTLVKGDDSFVNFTDRCLSRGYNSEIHKVRTRDDYILTLNRIPSEVPDSPIVFLMAGYNLLSDTWVLNDPAPGFLLSNAGFDVWFGNVRGTLYSREHAYLNPDTDPEYWDFTWNQMADFDLPASIEYILSFTHQSTLTYIGHSQGSIIMTTHLADDPEFIKNFDLIIYFSPVALFSPSTNPIFGDAPGNPFQYFYDNGIVEFSRSFTLDSVSSDCEGCPSPEESSGQFSDADNQDLVNIYFFTTTGGTSTRNFEMWLYQMTHYEEKKVQRYDYGRAENVRVYHKVTPPVFDLSIVPGPIVMFYGGSDKIVPKETVEWLIENLSNGAVAQTYFYPDFGHSSWFLAKDMSFFTDNVIPLISSYAQTNQNFYQFLQNI